MNVEIKENKFMLRQTTNLSSTIDFFCEFFPLCVPVSPERTRICLYCPVKQSYGKVGVNIQINNTMSNIL